MTFPSKSLPTVLSGMALLFLTSCLQEEFSEPKPSPPPVWNLEDFETSEYLLISITKAQVRFNESRTLLSTHANHLTIHLDSISTSLPKNSVWARYDVEKLKELIEKKKSRIQQLESDNQKRLEIDIPLQLIDLNKTIATAEENQRIKSQIDQNQELAQNPLLNSTLGAKINNNTTPEELVLLKKQRDHLEKNKNTPPPELQNTLETLQEEIKVAEEHLSKVALTMPFDGTLRVLVQEFQGKGTYPVLENQPIAQCDNTASLRFYLDSNAPQLLEREPENLVLRHKQIGGLSPVIAEFSENELDWQNNQRQRFLTFQPPEPESYLKYADSFVRVEILQKLGRPCHIVPKMKLLAFHEGPNSPDWTTLLDKLQPGFEIVGEAPSSIAIAPIQN